MEPCLHGCIHPSTSRRAVGTSAFQLLIQLTPPLHVRQAPFLHVRQELILHVRQLSLSFTCDSRHSCTSDSRPSPARETGAAPARATVAQLLHVRQVLLLLLLRITGAHWLAEFCTPSAISSGDEGADWNSHHPVPRIMLAGTP